MKKLLLVGLILSGCGINLTAPGGNKNTVSPDLFGTWTATGITDTIDTAVRTCDDGTFEITKSPITGSSDLLVILKQRVYNCANKSYQVQRAEVDLTLNNGKLYQFGTLVGTMTTTSLALEFNTATLNRKISVYLVGDTYTYTESQTGLSTTKATLKR